MTTQDTSSRPVTTGARGVTAARWWHGVAALMALAGVVMEVVAAAGDPGIAGTQLERYVRLFSYFTILSNILVAVTSGMLAANPQRDGKIFRIARLDALLCIAVTFVVYNTVLLGLAELSAAGMISNFLLHQGGPVVAVVAWFVVGPRPRVDRATIWWSVALPVTWIVYTFIRGAIVDWYPYPFLDVTEHGYPLVIVNTVIIAVIFLLLAAIVGWADRKLRPVPVEAGV